MARTPLATRLQEAASIAHGQRVAGEILQDYKSGIFP